jgi:hypothetical protein
VDPHCFDEDADPDPAQNLDADPDPDLDPDPGGGGEGVGQPKMCIHPWQNPRYAPVGSVSKRQGSYSVPKTMAKQILPEVVFILCFYTG